MQEAKLQYNHISVYLRGVIAREAADGATFDFLCQKYNITKNTMRRIAKENELVRPGRRLSKELREEIVDEYRKGKPQYRIADELGLSRSAVGKTVREAGINSNIRGFCPHCGKPIETFGKGDHAKSN